MNSKQLILNEYDSIFSFEAFENTTFFAMYYPIQKQVIIAINLNSLDKEAKEKIHHAKTKIEEIIQKRNKKELIERNINKITITYDFEKIIYNYYNQISEKPDSKTKGTGFSFSKITTDIETVLLSIGYYYAITKKVIYPKDLYQVKIKLEKEGKKPSVVVEYNAKNYYYNLKNSRNQINIFKLNEEKSIEKATIEQLNGQIGNKIFSLPHKIKKNSEITTEEDFINTINYIVNKVISTYDILNREEYEKPFNEKTQLEKEYQNTANDKRNQIKRDTTSANCITNMISPNKKLEDDEKINLLYPLKRGYMLNLRFEPYYNDKITQELNNSGNFNDYYLPGLIKNAEIKTGISTKEFDKAINDQIKIEAENDPLIKKIFYTEQEIPYINCNNKELQIDLLEFINTAYGMNEKMYAYYSAYRGYDLRKTTSKYQVPPELTPEIKNGVVSLLQPHLPFYVKASAGGLYGANINLQIYNQECAKWQRINKNLLRVKKQYMELVEESVKQNTNPLGWKIRSVMNKYTDKEYLAVIKKYKNNTETLAAITINGLDITDKKLSKFKEELLFNLNPKKYVTTRKRAGNQDKTPRFIEETLKPLPNDFIQPIIANQTEHVDIHAYYGSLIRILKIFTYTKDGEEIDPYENLLEDRMKIVKEIESIENWTKETYDLDLEQKVKKKTMNAGSGALDTPYEHNIRMKNKGYKVRISGQLCMYTLINNLTVYNRAIASSIHTDGAYFYNISHEEMQKEVKQWAEYFRLEADAETLDSFYSKDINNRIEIANNKIKSVGGGTIKYYKGISLTGTINHPVITDKVLSEYILEDTKVRKESNNSQTMMKEFNREFVRNNIENKINEALESDDREKTNQLLLQLQYISVSNEEAYRFIIMEKNGKPFFNQAINRLFYVTEEIEDIATKENGLQPVTIKMLTANNSNKSHYADALSTVIDLELFDKKLLQTKKVAWSKIPSVAENKLFIYQNDNIKNIDKDILYYIDIEAYIDIVENQWQQWSPIKII